MDTRRIQSSGHAATGGLYGCHPCTARTSSLRFRARSTPVNCPCCETDTGRSPEKHGFDGDEEDGQASDLDAGLGSDDLSSYDHH